MGNTLIDETGRRYTRLLVEARSPENDHHRGAAWLCVCDCGRRIAVSGGHLRAGLVKSCGCLYDERRAPHCACGYIGKRGAWVPDYRCGRCSAREARP
jgi:hypothetical protein